MKIIKIFVLILLFSFFNIKNIYSQEEEKKELRVNFSDFISTGFNTINIKSFDDILIKNNYKPFEGNFISLGTGGRHLVGNLILGSEGNFSIDKKNIISFNNTISYMSSNLNILGNIGYVIYEGNNFIIYPLAGIGLSRLAFDIIQNEKPGNINDVLQMTERGVRLENIGITGDIGLEIGYLVGVGKSHNKKGGLAFGLRSGYVFTLYQTGIKYKDFPIDKAPDVNFNGFYIKFLAGFTGSVIETLLDLF